MANLEHAVSDLSEFRSRAAASREPEEHLPSVLPAGTVTFLLTDIEGSTRRWEAHGPAMAKATARHYEILDAAVTGHGGVRPVEQGEGDSMVAAFARASDAAAAALEAQQALIEEDWPEGAALAVRMALHTGEAQIRDDLYYVGPSIIRCARLRALAYGGQVVISNTTADLLADGLSDGAALLPLGVHRLRDPANPSGSSSWPIRRYRPTSRRCARSKCCPTTCPPSSPASWVGRRSWRNWGSCWPSTAS